MTKKRLETSYTQLPDVFFSYCKPDQAPSPKVFIVNHKLAEMMGMNLQSTSSETLAAWFSGHEWPGSSQPLAQAYAGHQFGHFTMLGDGRAHLVREHVWPDGQRCDIAFKGSGRTPYARGGDGKAVLGPMLREYIISEAMHHLGVPTTRSLAVVTTGEQIMRDKMRPGAMLTRVADSHIRIGTFSFAAQQKNVESIQALLDYTVVRHFPQHVNSSQKALDCIESLMHKQADLMVHWMRVGFIHGVMNTDNVTLSGQTIDYGPCAFMDRYHPGTVFSSIDHMGRYAFSNQPGITHWNLAQFTASLLPLIHQHPEQAWAMGQEVLKPFQLIYENKWLAMMRSKLGLYGVQIEDEELVKDLLAWMQSQALDYTNTFLDLSSMKTPFSGDYRQDAFKAWYKRWQGRLNKNNKPLEQAYALMKCHNPAIIPRNHKVEQAIEAACRGDHQPTYDLLEALERPYDNRPLLKPYQKLPKPDEVVLQTFCGT